MDNDPRKHCPYDRSHFIGKSGLKGHLLKCQKAPGNMAAKNPVPLVSCEYDPNHQVEPYMLAYHHLHCPTLQLLVRRAVYVPVERPYVVVHLPPSEEDWDAVPPAQPYPTTSDAARRERRQLSGRVYPQQKKFNKLDQTSDCDVEKQEEEK